MPIQIRVDDRDYQFDQTAVVIGRQADGRPVDLDLSPDRAVSRQHARIWSDDGGTWIQDLNSSLGTRVDGREINGEPKHLLRPGSTVQIGQRRISVVLPDEGTLAPPPVPAPEVSSLWVTQAPSDYRATPATPATPAPTAGPLIQAVASILGGAQRVAEQLPRVVERVVAGSRVVERASILLGPENRLVAHFPANSRPSLSIAARAVKDGCPVVWPAPDAAPVRGADGSLVAPTLWNNPIACAVYVPLVLGQATLGCLCLENSDGERPNADECREFQTVGTLVALAVGREHAEEELRRRDEILENFDRLVPSPVAQRLRQQRGRLRRGGEFQQVTVLFADIRGFTRMSAEMEADDVTEMICDYFDRLVPLLEDHGGSVDKYVGDAIMAVFTGSGKDGNQVLGAVRAGVAMQQAVAGLNVERRRRKLPVGELGIGVHCGEAIQGFIGTRERLEFTAIGDTVNRASRYCDGARAGEVLISADAHQRIWRDLRGQYEASRTEIPTKHEGPLVAYRIEAKP